MSDNELDNEDQALDAELDQFEAAEQRAASKKKKEKAKKGVYVIVGIIAIGGLALYSILSGVNTALEQNRMAAQESKKAASQNQPNIPLSKTSNPKSEATSPEKESADKITDQKEKIKNIPSDSLLTKSEKNIEQKRIENAKENNTSVVSKLDSLKKKNTERKRNLSRTNLRTTNKGKNSKKALLEARLNALFTPGGSMLAEPNSSEELTFDWLEAAHTGGESGDDRKVTMVTRKSDLKELLGDETNASNSTNPKDTEQTSEALLGIKRNVGDEEFAMLNMAIDSSKPSPITATIMQHDSELDAKKLSCDYTKGADGESVQIRCNNLVYNKKTYPINVILLDPETRNANMADEVDKHWWKWVAYAAASFADGWLEHSVTKTSVINTDSSQTTQTEAIEDLGDRNRAALANIGSEALAPAKQLLNIEDTVHVYEYRPVILLFLDDLDI